MTKTIKKATVVAEKVEAAQQAVVETVKQELSKHVEQAHGFEEMTAESFTIPFLNIVQDLSPIYKQENKSPEVRLGALYDSVSQEVYQKILVIPVMYRRRFIEWKPREMGGGFVAIHENLPGDAAIVNKQMTLKNGNLIADTRQHYVLYQDHNGFWNPALISLKSTGIKTSQQWCVQMQRCKEQVNDPAGGTIARRQDMYERTYELTSGIERKPAGTWYAWRVRLLPEKTEAGALQEAKDFYTLLTKGNKLDVQRTYSQADEADEDLSDLAY